MDEINEPTSGQPPTESEIAAAPTAPGLGTPQAAPPANAIWGQDAGGDWAPPPGSGSWQPAWGQIPGWAPAPTGPRRPRSRVAPALVVLGALVLTAAGIFVGHGVWTRTVASPTRFLPAPGPNPGSSTPGSGSSSSGGPSNAASIAAKVDPGLVDINTALSYQQVEAAGTGMVLTSNGEVLTNNHVIDGATTISVTDIGNGRTYGATVVGYDISHDLAVLQLHNASGLQTVSIGNSDGLTAGEGVVAIGNAGGAGGSPSYAAGSVTALNQSITAGGTFAGSEQLNGLIQSNADIQPGDSGGPLANTSGQVVGIDTAGSNSFAFETGNGTGYSIPINGAITIAKKIEGGQTSTTVHIGATAFLGVAVQPSDISRFGGSSPIGGGFGNGTSTTSGVSVTQVLPGEPAASNGIVAGDTITSVDSVSVNSPSALTAALGAKHPGDKVQVTWTDQSGQSHTATVQLGSGPPQ